MAEQNMNWKEAHGFLGSHDWPLPKIVAKTEQVNRADQGNQTNASEWADCDEVVERKMAIVAGLIKRSKFCVAYTGAGLSRASGIPDYATPKGVKSVITAPKLRSNLDALPTYAHKVLVALERKGYLKHYVQQNHDGLPQKAGFPQEKINEIHGAWFDPSNPVVMFSGSLRSDLFEWMTECEKKTDLCLCLGTSLSGMNADRMACTPAKKSIETPPNALGTIIINLQRTHLDKKSAVRVWAPLDIAFQKLARILQLEVPNEVLPPLASDVNIVPYNSEGKLDTNCRMTLDLRTGKQVRVCNPGATFNEVAIVSQRTIEGDYTLDFETVRRRLGRWWINSAIKGAIPMLPIMNVDAAISAAPSSSPEPSTTSTNTTDEYDNDSADEATEIIETLPPSTTTTTTTTTNTAIITPPLPNVITVLQSHRSVNNEEGHRTSNQHVWGLYIDSSCCQFVKSVKWELHPTFRQPIVVCESAPFGIERIGWGTFTVGIEVALKSEYGSRVLIGEHNLTFKTDGVSVKATDIPTSKSK